MKLRNRVLIKILTALILLAVTLSIPLTAKAGDTDPPTSTQTNGSTGNTGNDDSSVVPSDGSGVVQLQSGYLAYIIDEDRNLVSSVVFLHFPGYSIPSSYNKTYLTSKVGGQSPVDSYTIDTSYPRPYTNGNGTHIGHGDQLAEKLKSPAGTAANGKDMSCAEQLVKNVWDENTRNEFARGHQYLILEAVWWFKISNNSNVSPLGGRCYAATSTGWATLFNDYDIDSIPGLASKTNYPFNKWTNMTFAICVTFEYEMLGFKSACLTDLTTGVQNFTVVSGDNVFPNAYIMDDSTASGMMIAWCEPDDQTTDDESLSIPHTAPDESEDGATYQIVKNYVDKFENADGSITYTDAGRFVKTDSTNTISIEDETSNTGYTLVEWRATDSSDTSVESINSSGTDITWQSNVPGSHSVGGMSEYTIDLEDDETILGTSGKTAAELGLKTVYLLLLKSDEEEVEKEDGVNFTISESAVTRRVSFSEDENEITDLK